MNIRTDLAVEARELKGKRRKQKLEGVEVFERIEDDVNITRVDIKNETGEKIMGKPKGSYITLEMPNVNQYDGEVVDEISKILSKELTPLMSIPKDETVLVVGLGNWNIVSDAVGPKVLSKMMITRHLLDLVPDDMDERIRPVCAITPGVLGITGIETAEVIKGITDRVKPSMIVAVDSLASRKMQRVNRTIQISNTGIAPGAGIGNKRRGLTEEYLGVPVIAIGVPTVVHAATIAYDTMNLLINQIQENCEGDENFYTFLGSFGEREKEGIIKDLLNPYVGNLMVTPKDVDLTIESMAKIIANGLNIALQPALTLDDVNTYIN